MYHTEMEDREGRNPSLTKRYLIANTPRSMSLATPLSSPFPLPFYQYARISPPCVGSQGEEGWVGVVVDTGDDVGGVDLGHNRWGRRPKEGGMGRSNVEQRMTRVEGMAGAVQGRACHRACIREGIE